jgi:methylenetetrahydrofolate reductase (NADPH)
MKVIDILHDALEHRRTRFAFELLPPLKGENIRAIYDTIDALREFDPAYINITHHREDVKYVERPGGGLERRVVRRRPGTIGISAAIAARYGIETVPHLICGGASRFELEDALIEMEFLGLRNVLALRGDALKGESGFKPHPDGYACAVDLVRHIRSMNGGRYCDAEIENCTPTNFCVGVAGYPEKHAEAPNRGSDIAALKAKVDAGAEYVVTQLFYDNAKYFRYVADLRAAGITVPVVPGLKPFSAKRQLSLLPQTFHVDLPDDLVREVEKCSDTEAVRRVGIEWAVAQAKELIAAGVPVLHFYTMGRSDNVEQIARQVF